MHAADDISLHEAFILLYHTTNQIFIAKAKNDINERKRQIRDRFYFLEFSREGDFKTLQFERRTSKNH